MDKVSLVTLPTPLQPLNSIRENQIYIKRDDLTGLMLGGNKTRKLEYFMQYILEQKHNYVVTYGSTESNHCTATAAAAKRLNLPCTLILSKPEGDDARARDRNGNFMLYHLLGAEISWTNPGEVPQTIDAEMVRLSGKGYNPYFIPGGGHGVLGTKAYVEAYQEINAQCRNLDLKVDYIFLASGTGTTQAGLVVGRKLLGGEESVIGISIARKEPTGKKVILDSISEYVREFDLKINISDDDVAFVDGYVGKGYGDINPGIIETIKMMARNEGILFDPVYTGKAFWGMLDYLEKNGIQDRQVLFIHTGGIPILFNHSQEFFN
ncbi:MAG TPA: D-cysteine desulfhydrase family protein [Bacillota bacterium]|nr:D-cysteine desulfhydrase family protein [Bacillota bacterium]